jgi:small-conductance mechanosensitive channel
MTRVVAVLLAATALCASAALAQDAAPARSYAPASVSLYNRHIVEFRAPLLGASPVDRAVSARERLQRLLDRGTVAEVAVEVIPQGAAVKIDGQLAFVVSNDDASALYGESAPLLAEAAAGALRRVATETREARDAKFLLRAALSAIVATAVWLALLGLAFALWRATARRLTALAKRHAPRLRVGGGTLISRQRAIEIARRAAAVLAYATIIALTFEWLGYVLGLFPYTRPWGEGLTGFLVGRAIDFLEAVARGMPSLFIAIVIFVFAYLVDRTQKRFFRRVEAGRIEFGSIDHDTAPPTRRLASIAIWLFAAVMAYPYIPGSDTEAFKGLSVLLGLMVSVGASGIVGQAASGFILMYTRTFRTGEYVRIGDREGTMTRIGMFTSTVRTGLGEELTMPNSMVLASVTTNYSRVVPGPGFMLAAKVSIGYDTPWRQVHAMLLDAARATPGVLADPPPRVFQTSLDDFYVQYRLVCQASPTDPLERAQVVSSLNAAIQDAFNAHGVQIMSPHYMVDPPGAKIVPPARWYAAPARRDGGETPG